MATVVTAPMQKFYQFVADLASGVHQLQTGTAHVFKFALTNTAFLKTAAVLASITQIANGNGYTTGGISGGTVTGSQTLGVFKFILGTDPVWTGSGAGMAPFRHVILYNDTPISPADPLIGYWDFGSSLTLAVGDTFTFNIDQTLGIFLIG